MKDFTMSQDQLDVLLNASGPVPLIAIQHGQPPSHQSNINNAWEALGKEMGFDGTTAVPNGKGDLHFSAEETDNV